VTVSSFLALLPLLLSLAAAQREPRDEPRDEPRPSVRRLAVERQWIVRVPVRPRPLVQRFEWTEGQGYKCVRTDAIRSAFLSGQDSVDFVLRRQRVRATLDGNCTALDFYDGFYLKTDDQRVCARRDFVHSRMGGSCRIERFQKLLPKPKG
jgi:hypothetical protein